MPGNGWFDQFDDQQKKPAPNWFDQFNDTEPAEPASAKPSFLSTIPEAPIFSHLPSVLTTNAIKSATGKSATEWWDQYIPEPDDKGSVLDKALGVTNRAARNLMAGSADFLATPAGALTTVAAARGGPVTKALLGAAFGTEMSSSTLHQAIKAAKDPSLKNIVDLGTDVLFTALPALSMVHEAGKANKAEASVHELNRQKAANAREQSLDTWAEGQDKTQAQGKPANILPDIYGDEVSAQLRPAADEAALTTWKLKNGVKDYTPTKTEPVPSKAKPKPAPVATEPKPASTSAPTQEFVESTIPDTGEYKSPGYEAWLAAEEAKRKPKQQDVYGNEVVAGAGDEPVVTERAPDIATAQGEMEARAAAENKAKLEAASATFPFVKESAPVPPYDETPVVGGTGYEKIEKGKGAGGKGERRTTVSEGWSFGPGDEPPVDSSVMLGGTGMEKLYDWAKSKLPGQGVETPRDPNALTPAQNITQKYVSQRVVANKEKPHWYTDPTMDPTAPLSKQLVATAKHVATKTEEELVNFAAPFENYQQEAIKKGAKIAPEKNLVGLADQALLARTAADQAAFDTGLAGELKKLSDTGRNEANELLTSLAVKDREIRKGGEALFNKALKDKANPYHEQVTAINDKIAEVRKQVRAASSATAEATAAGAKLADPQEIQGLRNLQAELEIERDQWMQEHGQSYWQHLIETDGQGASTGRWAREVETVLNDKEFNAKYEPVVKSFRALGELLEDKAVEDGIISPQLMEKLRRIYPNHARLTRMVSNEVDSPFMTFSNAVGHLSQQKSIMKARGGVEPIANVFESMQNKARQVFAETSKNRLGRTIAEYISKKGTPEETIGMSDMGTLVDPADIASGKFKPTPTNSIAYLDNGRTRYIKFDNPAIPTALRGVDPVVFSKWGRVMLASARTLRIGATGISSMFGARNLPRDYEHTVMNAANVWAVNNPKNFIESLGQAIFGGEDARALRRMGSGFTEQSIYRPETASRNIVGKTIRGVGDTVRMIENAIGKTEEAGRIRVFRGTRNAIMKPNGAKGEIATRYGIPDDVVARGLNNAEATAIASMESNRVLPPYHRAGRWIRQISSVHPYLNASIVSQTSQLGRLVTSPKVAAKRMALWGTMIGLPTLAVTAYNLNDPRKAAAYFDIRKSSRESNLILMPEPLEDETIDQYKARIRDKSYKGDNGPYRVTAQLPVLQGLYGEMQKFELRMLEDYYRRLGHDEFNKYTDQIFDTKTEAQTPGGVTPEQRPVIAPFTGREKLEVATGMISPYEPNWQGVSALMPPLGKAGADILADKDIRTGVPIHSPDDLKHMGLPEIQFGRNSTKAERAIASGLNAVTPFPVSPQQVRQVGRDLGASLYDYPIYAANKVMGEEGTGGQNPLDVASVFKRAWAGEQQQQEWQQEADLKTAGTKALATADKDYIPDYQFMQANGYTPSPGTKIDVKTGRGSKSKVVYSESDEEYLLRMQLRGLMIARKMDETLKGIDRDVFSSKLDRGVKQKIFRSIVSPIDDMLRSQYRPQDNTEADREERIANMKMMIGFYQQADRNGGSVQ